MLPNLSRWWVVRGLSGNKKSMSGQPQGSGGDAVAAAPRLLDVKWALRRALLGLVILTVGVGSVAWLTHASIDPALETSSVTRTTQE
jgi:hypothetical protein